VGQVARLWRRNAPVTLACTAVSVFRKRKPSTERTRKSGYQIIGRDLIQRLNGERKALEVVALLCDLPTIGAVSRAVVVAGIESRPLRDERA
jgi:hypothetical protein